MTKARPSLRERKKQQTREAIQDRALHLYREQGYHQTTVEQIADAANVSPSTFFRYYPTKPETVLYDRTDSVLLDAILAQPTELTPVAATRAALRSVFADMSDEERSLELTRMRLMADVPDLRAAVAERFSMVLPEFTAVIARRAGRESDDQDVQHWLGAVAGVVLVALFRAARDGAEILDAIDEAMAYLENGMPL
ncbi:TetR family transcriptional regulator [Nocardioides endophyticus]|uniref:TetR family transcriptional regulator n=1 Tax=Nocardioides endophyticus TaxID=1353775 RepID=A0ABP8Y6Y3_9ACTN